MKIEELRAEIDKIDDEIVKKFIERISLTDEIGRQKALRGNDIFDPTREKEIINRLTELTGDFTLKEDITALYSLIFSMSKCRQTNVKSGENKDR